MAIYILVHGAWHGGWCWRHVLPHLETQGHRVQTPDLPGHGDDPAPVGDQSLYRYAQRIQEVVWAAREPVILVGHSLGGLVISAVAETLPERVERLIYVSGFLPRNGDSLVRICSIDPDNPLNSASQRTADGKCLTVNPARARELFYADCPEADLVDATARLGPEPVAVMFETVRVTEECFGQVPRAYIHCSQDVALPYFIQAQMVAASPCERVLTQHTGHSPFYAAPERLASQLVELSAPGGNKVSV